jgi:hypothetical protein
MVRNDLPEYLQGPLRPKRPTFSHEEMRGLWVRTLTMLFIILFSGVIVMGLLSPSGRLAFIMFPLFLAVFLLYLASIFRIILKGIMANALSDSINFFAPCLCVSLIMLGFPPSILAELDPLVAPVFFLGVVLGVGALSRSAYPSRWVLIRFVLILILGWVAIILLSLLPYQHPDPLLPFLLGSLLPGLISLLGLFQGHVIPILRMLGRIFIKDLNVVLVSALGLLALVYLFLLRPLVISEASNQLPLLDWIAVALVLTLVVLWLLIQLRASSSVRVTGNWGRKMGRIVKGKGDREVATMAVDAFVENGRKEDLLVLLTSALLANGLMEGSISKVLSELVDYREKEVPLAFTWTYEEIAAAGKLDRLSLVDRTLDEAMKELDPSLVLKEGENIVSSEGGT